MKKEWNAMEYTITRGGQTALITTAGGELISYLSGEGPEYIWQGDPAFWAGRNPILFPIVGKLREGQIQAGRHLCQMPQHGLARQREFTPVRQEEDSILLEQRSDSETLAAYPFPYLLQMRHSLVEGGFSTAATVTNIGEEEMPFCLGGHTAFRCPLYPGEQFEDYELVFDQPEPQPALVPTPEGLLSRRGAFSPMEDGRSIPLSYPLFDRAGTLVFDSPRSQGVSLRHKERGHGLRLDYSGFPMVAFWTPTELKAPFVCIEPWQGCAAFEDESGQFSQKPYAVLLAPGASWSMGYTVTTL